MKAVIMAGGRGSRLRPLTNNCPKPMIPFANKPVLEHILKLLKRCGVTEVVITVHYLADQIQDYFSDGRRLDMQIQYAVEAIPLGTAGGVKNAASFLTDEPFLVISGDVITDVDLLTAWQAHCRNQAMATLVLKQVPNPEQYGIVAIDELGRIIHYLEKPTQLHPPSCLVNTGIYILDPQILALIPPNRPADFSYDIFPCLLREDVAMFGHQTEGYWSDIGTIESYLQTLSDALQGQVKHLDIKSQVNGHSWFHQLASLIPSALIPSAFIPETLMLEVLILEALTDEAFVSETFDNTWFNYLPNYEVWSDKAQL